jgi:hypothetical protein
MPESFFKVDVNLFDHPKIVGLSDAAFRLYLSSIAYANRLMTDGYVAEAVIGRLIDVPWDADAKPLDYAAELVRAQLWETVEGGYEVHDFLDHNRSKAERLGHTASETARKAAYRQRQREASQDPAGPDDGGDGGVPPGQERDSDAGQQRTRDGVSRRIEKEERQRQKREDNTIVEQARPIDDVTHVFQVWQEATRKHRARLDDKRRRRIRQALQHYPLQDVLDAVQGWQHSPHHTGQNNSGAVYNDLDLLLRDAEHLEKFRDLQRDGPPAAYSRPTTQLLAEDARMARWVQQMEGGEDAAPRVAPDPGPARRELPRPGTTG